MPSENATTVEVLALLTLPTCNDLSEQQVRGTTCVWDGVALTADTAVDLGPRTRKLLDVDTQWFPRSCRSCGAEQALRALFDHAPLCEQCVDNAAGCEIAVGLRRLMRGGRR